MREDRCTVETVRSRYTLQYDPVSGCYWVVALDLATGEQEQGGPFDERFGLWALHTIVQLEKVVFQDD